MSEAERSARGSTTEDLCLEHFAADLAEADIVDRLQVVLGQFCPRFAGGLRVLAYEGDRSAEPVGVGNPGALRRAVVTKGMERGATDDALTGPSPLPHPRLLGDVIVRGSAAATTLSVRFDEYVPCRPSGDRWLFSNSIGARIRPARIEGTARAEWVTGLVQILADDPRLLWAAAYVDSEFAARNLHDEADGMWALGRDVRRSLPGLFWLNVFGPPYRRAISQERLDDVPATTSRPLEHSHMVVLYPSPEAWATNEGSVHRDALQAIGPAFFFDRSAPGRPTVAPDLGLPPLRGEGPLTVALEGGQHAARASGRRWAR